MKSEGEIQGAMERLNITRKEAETVEYMGDGVYASYDGYHFWLRTLEGQRIALDQQVFGEVVSFGKRYL